MVADDVSNGGASHREATENLDQTVATVSLPPALSLLLKLEELS
jgi:hypothetical protein